VEYFYNFPFILYLYPINLNYQFLNLKDHFIEPSNFYCHYYQNLKYSNYYYLIDFSSFLIKINIDKVDLKSIY
jgi:hypothetical protein